MCIFIYFLYRLANIFLSKQDHGSLPFFFFFKRIAMWFFPHWLDHSHLRPSGSLAFGGLSHCPKPGPPPAPPLSGSRPKNTGACTYHIQRSAALLDTVHVEHHNSPPEDPQICVDTITWWKHTEKIRILGSDVTVISQTTGGKKGAFGTWLKGMRLLCTW